MQEAGKRYAADSDAEAFGVGAGFSDASKAAYDSAREAYNTARLNYERTQALDDWASDPAHLESRDEWTRNGWTWDERFFQYLQTGDKSVLDDLVYGYGAFMADDRQRAICSGRDTETSRFSPRRHSLRLHRYATALPDFCMK